VAVCLLEGRWAAGGCATAWRSEWPLWVSGGVGALPGAMILCCLGVLCDGPTVCRGELDAEDSEAGKVEGGGEHGEVGGDTGLSPDSGPPVPASGQMLEVAFDFGAGRLVVGFPGGVWLAGAFLLKISLIPVDVDFAAIAGRGASPPQWAGTAGDTETGDTTVTVLVPPDLDSVPGWAGDTPGLQINTETVFRIQAVPVDRGLDFAFHIHPRLV